MMADPSMVTPSGVLVDSSGVHRYNAALPPAQASAVPRESAALLGAILSSLARAAPVCAYGAAATPLDFLEGVRQLRRLNALNALKFALPDEAWAACVSALLRLALADVDDLSRQTAFLNAARSLLRRKRPAGLISIEWHPLWLLLQTTHYSHIPAHARASEHLVGAHLSALLGLVRRASRYFPGPCTNATNALTRPR